MGERKIVLLTLLLEGILVFSFYIWAKSNGFAAIAKPEPLEILRGLLYALPLLVVNLLIFGPAARHSRRLYTFHRFCNEIIKPLADELGTISALLVSLAAGLGEELFFRGLLQSELRSWSGSLTFAVFASAILFALLHFGAYVRRYFLVAFVYTLTGIYFGCLAVFEPTLWPAIICHAAYDFIALLYLRLVYVKPPRHPCEL